MLNAECVMRFFIFCAPEQIPFCRQTKTRRVLENPSGLTFESEFTLLANRQDYTFRHCVCQARFWFCIFFPSTRLGFHPFRALRTLRVLFAFMLQSQA